MLYGISYNFCLLSSNVKRANSKVDKIWVIIHKEKIHYFRCKKACFASKSNYYNLLGTPFVSKKDPCFLCKHKGNIGLFQKQRE